ncbi:MAG: amino acid ABC transporter substrate-binding protein [Spirochaetia bacterium]|nr:amino acid ABC transporter substrate-binding protein [Spirochaetia bacterium]
MKHFPALPHRVEVWSIVGIFLVLALSLEAQQKPVRPEKNGPAKHASIMDQIRSRGTLRIAMQEDYTPFVMENPVEGYPGIDVEVGMILASALGVKLERVTIPLTDIFQAVNAGTVDMGMGGISASLDRARLVNFSDPYMVTSPAALVFREALPPDPEGVNYPRRQYKSLADLKYIGALNIGVRVGTANAALLVQDPEFKKHTIRQFSGRGQVLQALEKHQVDALVADDIYVRVVLLKRPELLNKFVPLTDTYQEEHISIAMRPGDAELWLYLNFFVKELRRTGRLQKISKKYFESTAWFR